jgi:hypothetical protein
VGADQAFWLVRRLRQEEVAPDADRAGLVEPRVDRRGRDKCPAAPIASRRPDDRGRVDARHGRHGRGRQARNAHDRGPTSARPAQAPSCASSTPCVASPDGFALSPCPRRSLQTRVNCSADIGARPCATWHASADTRAAATPAVLGRRARHSCACHPQRWSAVRRPLALDICDQDRPLPRLGTRRAPDPLEVGARPRIKSLHAVVRTDNKTHTPAGPMKGAGHLLKRAQRTTRSGCAVGV